MSNNRKYSQLVFAEMTRFNNGSGQWHIGDNGVCYLVRNRTRIEFGNSDNLIGTVIMTNPGSYGLDKVKGWNEFRVGHGDAQKLEGHGFPDLTMQNIIMVVQEAFKRRGKAMPQGSVNILNISNVVCPKGYKAEEYHNMLKQLFEVNELDGCLLESINDQKSLKLIFEDSPFVMLGFVKDVFKEKAEFIKGWSLDNYASRTISALDKNNWPSHPRRWRTEKELAEKAITSLGKIL